ncbi:hypothetical protein ABZ512_21430 [Nocardiopsis dassonvillei]|uniref:hypothetical protein n=1 Tax=Nocardiopsis dassonvillei TaxID=2014 RepID=UPI0033F87AC6
MQRITAYLSSLLLSRRDDGYSTETVIITAALIGVTVVLIAAITTRVTNEANAIMGG